MQNPFKVIARILILALAYYILSPSAKMAVHHGISLSSHAYNFEFREYPNLFSFFGLDGKSTETTFEIEYQYVQDLVDHIGPNAVWVRYSLVDSSLSDTTVNSPALIPQNAIRMKAPLMLYDNGARSKGDGYNIWIKFLSGTIARVTVHSVFT